MKKLCPLFVFVLVIASWFVIYPVYAFDLLVFEETFEGSVGWSAENGVWEVGTPTSGPNGCHGGSNCAGTISDDNYPSSTDSRFILPYHYPWEQGLTLPLVSANQELYLKFWNWFSYSTHDYGQVQISVWDPGSSEWGPWVEIGSPVVSSSGGWSLKGIEISSNAGETVRFGFFHNAHRDPSYQPSEAAGWFIDDIQVLIEEPTFTGDFETGWGDWFADIGVWQIGTPTSGPQGCYESSQCAGTFLDGDYPSYTDSRLISATKMLDEINGAEEIHLKFWNWFSYSTHDYGQVQISVWDFGTSQWEPWEDIGSPVVSSSGGWSLKGIDISNYAGETVRFGFSHSAHRDPSYQPSEGGGWFVDDIQVVTEEPTFTGDFEAGWVDWFTDTGVWQVGTPTSGPQGCYEGSQCAGTVLEGYYPSFTDSLLISASTTLGDISGREKIYLKFWNWFSYSTHDYGRVQISVWDPASIEWGPFKDIGSPVVSSSAGWSLKGINISDYAGETVRFGFFHSADRDPSYEPSEGAGWFIDGIQIVIKEPTFTGDFEMGWVDWFADTGVWQVGAPASGPAGCFEGSQCAGTVLDEYYPSFTDSRLISATIDLSDIYISTLFLRFHEWFSFSSHDYGEIQVSVLDEGTKTWSDWITKGSSTDTSPAWTDKYVELSEYIGQQIRIGFLHTAHRDPSYSPSESHGWFIDNVELVGPTQIMPIIRYVSYSGYIPDPCTSPIDVFASDPFDSEPSYLWQIPDGGELEGSGASMEFIPDEIRFEPYTVHVSACSGITNLCSFTKTLNILTTVVHDYEPDDDIDGSDLKTFADTVTPEDIERFALEFGLVVCQ